MAIKANDLRRGMGVRYEGVVMTVWSSELVAKGNKRSYMQVEMRNVLTGQIIDRRFNVGDRLEEVFFDRKPMEYLYADSNSHVLMDTTTYEQLELPLDLIGAQAVYLTPNIALEVSFVDGRAVGVELPNTVELKVTETPPQVKGATATNQLKEAICEGGAKIKVPPFVENGTVVRVDTRTGEYLGRA
ncbi:MAG: elongation factor P [Planctomycetota bacterium]|nr:elongation factor P [Planctomycetota bacterium]